MAKMSEEVDHLLQLPADRITNGVVIDLLPKLTRGEGITWSQFHEIVQNKYDSECSLKALQTKLTRIYGRYMKLNKTKQTKDQNDVKVNYLQEPFEPPGKIVQPPKNAKVDQDHDAASPKKRKVYSNDQVENLGKELERFKDIVQKTEREVMTYKKKVKHLEKELKKNKEKVQSFTSIFGSVRGGRKRITETIKRLKQSKREWRINYQMTKSEEKRKTIEITRLRAQLQEEKRRRQRIQKKYTEQEKIKVAQKQQEIEQLKETVENLQDEKNKSHHPQQIQTKIGQSYTPQIREASYYLQNLGVAEGKVSEAIRVVAETLCDVTFTNELPSRQTQGRFASEMKAICRDQIEEHFVSKSNTTLKYDGTTKSRVGHLVECELASKEKTYLVGLRQQAGGTSLLIYQCYQ
nr:golgin subfamily A member 6-like protein 6 [Lytechinus pictus]